MERFRDSPLCSLASFYELLLFLRFTLEFPILCLSILPTPAAPSPYTSSRTLPCIPFFPSFRPYRPLSRDSLYLRCPFIFHPCFLPRPRQPFEHSVSSHLLSPQIVRFRSLPQSFTHGFLSPSLPAHPVYSTFNYCLFAPSVFARISPPSPLSHFRCQRRSPGFVLFVPIFETVSRLQK